jgi:D-serine deaminase-like pyridoxal phosphate-dependent protein
MIRYLEFQKAHPSIQFSTLVDNLDSLKMFALIAKKNQQNVSLWIDINNGMNRTGIIPSEASELFFQLQNFTHLNFNGIHVYDGHIRPLNLSERIDRCNQDFKAVEMLINQIEERGGVVSQIIAGGSPSFFPHSLRDRVFLSPGTTLLWDLGYKKIWQESPFLNAAVLVTRLISKPQKNIFCFDLGHKAVASEMPLPRVEIFGLEKAQHLGQSEEHLMVKFDESNSFKVGDLFYALPYHICPTVAKYNKVYTVVDGVVGPLWDVEARAYQL